MKKRIKFVRVFLALILVFVLSNHVSAKSDNSIHGKWQTIIDGCPGEGALFYRFDFEDNGVVTITKQFGGSDNIVETKEWNVVDNQLKISGKENQKIKEFDDALLKIENNTTIQYTYKDYNGIIKPYTHNLALIHWLLIVVVLVVLNELFRKSKWATILFFVVLPLILTPLVWSQHGVTYWFKWVKIYSVVFAVIWFTLIRFTRLGNYNWVKLIAALFLAVNIAEAVSQDFSMGYLPNVLNGVAGVLNIITLFYGWKLIGPDNSKTKDMIWPGMTIFWIIAYDI